MSVPSREREHEAMKILQIIPADGWVAVYKDGASSSLVCWALVDGYRDSIGETVIGMTTEGDHDVMFADGQDLEGYFYRPLP